MGRKSGKPNIEAECPYTMININLNAFTNMHTDGKNASISLIVNVGDYQEGRGGLWMSDPKGKVLREIPDFVKDGSKPIPPMFDMSGWGRRKHTDGTVDIKEGFFKPREWLKGNLHDP